MIIFNVTNPVTMGLLALATALLIFLGKEIKKPYIPAIALIFYLILLIIHSVQIGKIPEVNLDETRAVLLGCLGFDLIMIFLSFFGYLWIDDVSSKFYKKKSVDNSLDWFWNQV